jgi:type II secretory pathway component PulF
MMSAFRYQGLQGGSPVSGVIEAPDRREALRRLGEKGVFPSNLEPLSADAGRKATTPSPSARTADRPPSAPNSSTSPAASPAPAVGGFRLGSGIRRKEITAFTRELAALLAAAIPIPQALAGIAEEEANPALKEIIEKVSLEVKGGVALSSALAAHPRLFPPLYTSMIRVGEEAGALPRVIADLADLLENADEVRGEVTSAVAYPLFVLGFGMVTVAVLLTVVLPKLFSMLEDMLDVLPLPTLILLRLSGFCSRWWPWLLTGAVLAGAGAFSYFRSPRGRLAWDGLKLRVPVLGPLVRSAALNRFARTLSILLKSGVSLLPSLKIVEATVGNLVIAGQIAQVAEETRGGDSLAAPLRKLGLFPRSAVQMISAGEESGKLDEMLGKVAQIEERHLRARTKTLVSLLAPILILIVGGVVGFMVIAILLPIFRMSRGVH